MTASGLVLPQGACTTTSLLVTQTKTHCHDSIRLAAVSKLYTHYVAFRCHRQSFIYGKTEVDGCLTCVHVGPIWWNQMRVLPYRLIVNLGSVHAARTPAEVLFASSTSSPAPEGAMPSPPSSPPKGGEPSRL